MQINYSLQMYDSIIVSVNILNSDVQRRTPRVETLSRTGLYDDTGKLSMSTESLNKLTTQAMELWKTIVQWRFIDHRGSQELQQFSMKADILVKILLDVAENLGNGVTHPRWSERVDRTLVNNVVSLKLATLALGLEIENWHGWMQLVLSPLVIKQKYKRYSNLLLSRMAWRFGSQSEKRRANSAILDIVKEHCCFNE